MASNDRVELFIFVELCRSFPVPKDIDLVALAREMGSSPGEFLNSAELHWEGATLPSGELLGHFYGDTVRWLIVEGFIRSEHATGVQGLVLTAKALMVLDIMPEALKEKRASSSKMTRVNLSARKKRQPPDIDLGVSR